MYFYHNASWAFNMFTSHHRWSSGGVAMGVRLGARAFEGGFIFAEPFDHLLGLPANPSVSNLGIWLALLLPCSRLHLLLKLFFFSLVALALLKYFSSVWPQLCPIFGFTILFFGLNYWLWSWFWVSWAQLPVLHALQTLHPLMRDTSLESSACLWDIWTGRVFCLLSVKCSGVCVCVCWKKGFSAIEEHLGNSFTKRPLLSLFLLKFALCLVRHWSIVRHRHRGDLGTLSFL